MSSKFFRDLNKQKINYCHWKSNNKIDLDSNFVDDYDLLLNSKDRKIFEKYLKTWNSKLIYVSKSIYHCVLILKNCIIHLHIYYELKSSGLIYKNYCYPSSFLLNNNISYFKKTIRIANEYDDFVFLITRKIAEFHSPIELIISLRNAELEDEILFFQKKKLNSNKIKQIIDQNDILNFDDFKMFQLLYLKKKYLKIFFLSFKYFFKMKKFRSKNFIFAELIRSFIILKIIFYKTKKNDSKFLKLKRGFILSIIGPDNSGKSTIIKKITNFYSKFYCTENFHMGSPKINFLQKVINFLSNLFSKNSKLRNSSLAVNGNTKLSYINFLIISIKSILTAYSRYLENRHIYKHLIDNKFIITDRYVKESPSYFDGPKIPLLNSKNKLILFLSSIESYFYKKIQPCDLAVYIQVPHTILHKRNKLRKKNMRESTDYLTKSIHETMHYRSYKSKTFLKIHQKENDIHNTVLKIHSFLLMNNYISHS